MKHLKTYEGLFDFLKKKPSKIDAVRDYCNTTTFDLLLKRTMTASMLIYEFTIGSDNIVVTKIEYQEYDVEAFIEINDEEVLRNEIKRPGDTGEVFAMVNNLKQIFANSHNLFSIISDQINNYAELRVINRKELLERCIEFDIIRNNDIDYLNVKSVFDYYGAKFDHKRLRDSLLSYVYVKDNDSYLALNESVNR